MKRLSVLLVSGLASLLLAAGAQAFYPAQGNFGVGDFDVTFTDKEGKAALLAGTHPFAVNVELGPNLDVEGNPEGRPRDFFFEQIPGLVGDTTAYPTCSTLEFLELDENGTNACPLDTTLGITAVSTETKPVVIWTSFPVFNLEPPPGVLLRLGFRAVVENIVVDIGLGHEAPYLPTASSRYIPQLADLYGVKTQLWGDPSDPAHDALRGPCGFRIVEGLPPGLDAFQFGDFGDKSCPVDPNPRPFITLPTNCEEPLLSSFEAFSWEGDKDAGGILTHDDEGNPEAFSGCGKLTIQPTIDAQPTNKAASSPTGLDFELDIEDEGLTTLNGAPQSHVRKVVATLPEGVTVNPSQAEGLEVCSEQDLEEETLQAQPGEGCPQASKIGTLEVESPLVEEAIKGALFVAAPRANLAEDSLLAVYAVFKNRELGVIVKQPLKVTPDPKTGQLITTADNIPQLPFSHFRLHFREGGRSPLVTPPHCGTYEVKAVLTPWSGTPPVTATSSFKVISGPNESPCPPGGTPPFEPGFGAGSINNAAGQYSPFAMRLTRRDGDQDLTRFDATLPPGVLAKLAGVDKCPDAQIALAKTKTGKAELASPSCPLNSRIGGVQAGAGVGSQLTYVPGTIYMAGPFGGAPLSAVAVVPAVAGPFDVGTVVTRQALDVNPRTGEVTADGAKSDPIPHILQGIPLVVRDIQVSVDRSSFTINPTDCDPFATKAAIWGGGSQLFSTSDDAPVSRSARYQVANCARLGFKPRLSLKLKGGTKRGGHPALHAVLRPRAGDANIAGTVVRLPRSAFLDQAHIRTVCTRVQYAAKSCPPGAIYGHVRAFSPLLAEPLEGPAYLRSSDNKLPDLVFALSGIVDFEAVARIDSKKGGIRATFNGVPDAPVSKVLVDMQGAKKGLIVNSTDLCARKHRANVRLDAHSEKRSVVKPVVKPSCKKPRRSR